MFRKNSQGFTLIEVLMVIAIAIIVVSIGIPSYQTSIKNNRKTTAINDLRTALSLARSSAITRRERVTVCRSNDGAICNAGAGSGNWSQGWMIFTNPNNGNTVLNSGGVLLRVHGALKGDISYIGNNNVINQISFSPQGLARGSNGTITYCDTRGVTQAGALVIAVSGQVRYALDSNGDNIVDVEGVNVSCPSS
jgi:type IV fimbrial biogenesis protein FimT